MGVYNNQYPSVTNIPDMLNGPGVAIPFTGLSKTLDPSSCPSGSTWRRPMRTLTRGSWRRS